MPLYEYQCQTCGRTLEKRQKFSDAELTECPQCGGKLERLISAPAVQFKGGGWYADLYSSSKGSAKPSSEASAASGSSSSDASSNASSAATPAASSSSASAASTSSKPTSAAAGTGSTK